MTAAADVEYPRVALCERPARQVQRGHRQGVLVERAEIGRSEISIFLSLPVMDGDPVADAREGGEFGLLAFGSVGVGAAADLPPLTDKGGREPGSLPGQPRRGQSVSSIWFSSLNGPRFHARARANRRANAAAYPCSVSTRRGLTSSTYRKRSSGSRRGR